MITYVDTSMLVKLLVDEDGTDAAIAIWARAEHLVAVPLVEVEARAALAAAARARRITPSEHRIGKQHLTTLLRSVLTVEVEPSLVAIAGDLAETEALRGYDAVHLAGALRAASLLASADRTLCAAAERLGLRVANPLD